ncbi:MAG: sulfite exporter TauE/SafE family protein, partial [Planctomycetes bacterium]|nr:sulfite exporter TauE/SafE family protein [Planctomycetota bacterium]
MIGFSKTGVPGSGIIIAPLMASAMAAKDSTGFTLVMLAIADVMAILYWRRHVNWGHLARLLPWTLGGVVIGFLLMDHISDQQLKIIMGALILGFLGVSWWREKRVRKDKLPNHWFFAAMMGMLAGSTSMMANAAGPVMVIYLIAMRVPKNEFIGTRAWFFWILNLSKLPFSTRLGFITKTSMLTNAALIPFILIGGFLGVALVNRIPEKAFTVVVKALTVVA